MAMSGAMLFTGKLNKRMIAGCRSVASAKDPGWNQVLFDVLNLIAVLVPAGIPVGIADSVAHDQGGGVALGGWILA